MLVPADCDSLRALGNLGCLAARAAGTHLKENLRHKHGVGARALISQNSWFSGGDGQHGSMSFV